MRFDDRWCFANAHKAFFHSKSAESARWWKAETINGLKYIFSVKQLEFPWAFIYLCLFSEFSFRLKSNSSIAQQGSDWRALYLSFRLEIVKRYFFMSHIIYFCDTRGEKKKSSWNVNRISFSILIYVNGTFFIFFFILFRVSSDFLASLLSRTVFCERAWFNFPLYFLCHSLMSNEYLLSNMPRSDKRS